MREEEEKKADLIGFTYWLLIWGACDVENGARFGTASDVGQVSSPHLQYFPLCSKLSVLAAMRKSALSPKTPNLSPLSPEEDGLLGWTYDLLGRLLWGPSWWPSGQNHLAVWRTPRFDSWSGKPHVLRGLPEPQLLSPLKSLRAPSGVCVKENPIAGGWPSAAPGSSPCLPQLERARVQPRRPRAAANRWINKN